MWYIFTARKRSLGQSNVFSPIGHAVHRGGGCIPTYNGQGCVYPSMQWDTGCVSQHEMGQGCLSRGVSARCLPGGVCPGGCLSGRTDRAVSTTHTLSRHPTETATETSSAHATGMHSCQ